MLTLSFVLSLLAAEPTSADVAHFEQHVRPLLVKHCYECHSAESKILQGGLLLDSRPGWQKGGDSGAVIVPGKPDDSLLVRALRYSKDEFVHMPPKGKLPEADVAVFVEWVKRGAPDPRAEAPKAAAKRTIDIEAGKQHWAFQPLRRSEPPAVRDAAWCRTPVDRFILAKLEAAGLKPNSPADERKLLRRATYDLVGLPPSPEEANAFASATSPSPPLPRSHAARAEATSGGHEDADDRYAALVDRLLASPHYGERWGRHWLDLARFAESHGFEQDYDRPNAYHYRDFVIRALNDDLPYDTFVKWQIAGDEYEPENPLALQATGFLAAGVHATQITANQAEKERYDELDDITRTIGTTMLGLTLGCARCHDHKYDPLTNADYYRVAATFTTTVRSDYDVNLDPAGFRAAMARWEPRHRPLVAARQAYERDVLRPKFDAWLKARTAPDGEPRWIVLDVKPSDIGTAVKFAKQADGSVAGRGTQFFAVNYQAAAETKLTNITAVRLEVFRDDRVPAAGPGTQPEGVFQLQSLKVQAVPVRKGSPVDGKFVRLIATHDRDRPEAAKQGTTARPESWSIAPAAAGRDHAAAFILDKPLGFDGGAKLNFTLGFGGNYGGVARYRLAVAVKPEVPDLAALVDGGEASEAALTALRALAADPKKQPSSAERDVLFAWYRTQDAEWRKLQAREAASDAERPKPTVAKMLISSEGVPAVRLHTQGPDFYDKTYVLRRGDPNQKVEEAQPGFVQVLMRSADDERRWKQSPPAGARTSYRRQALAEWLTDVEHGAGHLLARVIVNRLWYYHFGTGLVSTPSDFGLQGAKPSHPELLDYLATELIREGWRLKPIHKLIMTSTVYRQTAATDAERTKADPENRLWWHKPLRRLEGEVVRDALMQAAGTLDPTMFGPGSLDPLQPRRSIYFFVKRSKLVPMMSLFDGPDTLQDLAVRPETTVAPQALMLLNNEGIRRYAEALAKRIRPTSPGDVATGIAAGYARTIGREPTADELRDTAEFLRLQTAAYRAEGKSGEAEHLAWADFCQVLFGLNEFVYVE